MTIFALSTGPGISGLAVIRLSGEECKNVLNKLTNFQYLKPRIATLTKIKKIKSDELIDHGLVLYFPSPQSYTGEDMLEFHVHGSRAVLDSLLSSEC